MFIGSQQLRQRYQHRPILAPNQLVEQLPRLPPRDGEIRLRRQQVGDGNAEGQGQTRRQVDPRRGALQTRDVVRRHLRPAGKLGLAHAPRQAQLARPP
jgi:hypothetical protein